MFMIKQTVCTSILLLLIAISTIDSYANAVIPSKEREALIALYNSTGGDTTWIKNDFWLGPVHLVLQLHRGMA